MLKVPPAAHTDSCGVSDANLSWTFAAGAVAPMALAAFASETPHTSVRSAGGTLSIPHLTRCHAVVGQSPDP